MTSRYDEERCCLTSYFWEWIQAQGNKIQTLQINPSGTIASIITEDLYQITHSRQHHQYIHLDHSSSHHDPLILCALCKRRGIRAVPNGFSTRGFKFQLPISAFSDHQFCGLEPWISSLGVFDLFLLVARKEGKRLDGDVTVD